MSKKAKLEELVEKLTKMNKELKELKGQMEALEKEKWKPQAGELYYHIASTGDVFEKVWINDTLDNGRKEIGNCFGTRDEAIHERERLKVIQQMKKYAVSKEERSYAENLLGLVYQPCSGELEPMIFGSAGCGLGTMLFETDEDIENCIEEIGEERLKKYYFGV